MNQVSSEATAMIDVRFLSEESPEAIVHNIRKVCLTSTVETLVIADAFAVDIENPHLKFWQDLCKIRTDSVFIQENSASDGRFFVSRGIFAIVSKPNGGNIHHPKEWSSLSSIIDYKNMVYLWLKSKL